MDREKMAEGRRRAAEQRQVEELQRQAEAEACRIEREKEKQRLREEWENRALDAAVIRDFDQLPVQMETFYNELSILSKKTPDAKLNKFKLKFLNDTLGRVNAILGATHRPFPDFEVFADHEFTSNSDAVFILSQYLKSLEQFFTDHSERRTGSSSRHWRVKGTYPEPVDDEDLEDLDDGDFQDDED
jgi:hypothetical protein